MSRYDFVGTCDICNENVPEQDELRFVDDVFYCPGCFEDAVAAGKVNETEYYDDDDEEEEEEEG